MIAHNNTSIQYSFLTHYSIIPLFHNSNCEAKFGSIYTIGVLRQDIAYPQKEAPLPDVAVPGNSNPGIYQIFFLSFCIFK